MIGVHSVGVQVSDRCESRAQTWFDICVYTILPTIDCGPDTIEVNWGNIANGTVNGQDPDGGPSPLWYSMLSFDGPGSVSVNPATGGWSWPTQATEPYLGYHELCIMVRDGALSITGCSEENADTCCLTIRIQVGDSMGVREPIGGPQVHRAPDRESVARPVKPEMVREITEGTVLPVCNSAPMLDEIPDMNIHWGDYLVYQVAAFGTAFSP